MGRIWRALKLGMKSLLLHKLRSGLTVLGIVFGVAAVISMLAIAEGTSRAALEQIRALGATNIIIRSVKPSDDAQASGGNRPSQILNYGLKYSDFDRIVETIPTIRKVLPVREIRKQIRRGSYAFDGRVVGTTEDYADFNLLRIAKGRFLTATDNERYENFVVLAHDTAGKLFPYEDPVNQTIKLGADYYTVVGVTAGARKRARGHVEDRKQPGIARLQQRRLYSAQYLPAPIRRANHRPAIGLAPGGRDPAHPDHDPGGDDGRGAADGSADRSRVRALSPQEGRRKDGPVRLAAPGPESRRAVRDHPGHDRGHLAAGRRDRHHEYHAGDRDGTHP